MTKNAHPEEAILPIGYKNGCFTVIEGFETFRNEKIKEREEEKRITDNPETIARLDGIIGKLKESRNYKIQCKCGKCYYRNYEFIMRKRWRECSEECDLKLQREERKKRKAIKEINAYTGFSKEECGKRLVGNIHESLEILGRIDDFTGNELEEDDRCNTGAVWMMPGKQYRCRCYLCGKEYEFSFGQFEIKKDMYGSRARWGYYCEACCDCHCISSFQWRTVRILEEYGLMYRVEVSFPDLISERGKPLRYDFAILNEDGSIKSLIECQGEQHFKIGNGYGGYVELNSRQARDEKKREYARINHIPLIEVTYKYDTYAKEEEYLKKEGVIS